MTHHSVSRHLSAIPPQNSKIEPIPKQQEREQWCKYTSEEHATACYLQNDQCIACHAYCDTDFVHAQKVRVNLQGTVRELMNREITMKTVQSKAVHRCCFEQLSRHAACPRSILKRSFVVQDLGETLCCWCPQSGWCRC